MTLFSSKGWRGMQQRRERIGSICAGAFDQGDAKWTRVIGHPRRSINFPHATGRLATNVANANPKESRVAYLCAEANPVWTRIGITKLQSNPRCRKPSRREIIDTKPSRSDPSSQLDSE
jgi:hypothetical protein